MFSELLLRSEGFPVRTRDLERELSTTFKSALRSFATHRALKKDPPWMSQISSTIDSTYKSTILQP